MKKIVISGPESTGKTTLSEALALELNAILIPEYARYYIESLDKPYTFSDVEAIAKYQMKEELNAMAFDTDGIIIMDTWLIITRVWFDVVFGRIPEWIDNYIVSSKIDLFLICAPDLPWVADPVRENGGEMRQRLFERYCREIEHFGFSYEIVVGTGAARVENALKFIKAHHIV
ncbi:MAG: ATP-binding protein [Prolixibacteraceae bacterium]